MWVRLAIAQGEFLFVLDDLSSIQLRNADTVELGPRQKIFTVPAWDAAPARGPRLAAPS
jgi:hypothetical protein